MKKILTLFIICLCCSCAVFTNSSSQKSVVDEDIEKIMSDYPEEIEIAQFKDGEFIKRKTTDTYYISKIVDTIREANIMNLTQATEEESFWLTFKFKNEEAYLRITSDAIFVNNGEITEPLYSPDLQKIYKICENIIKYNETKHEWVEKKIAISKINDIYFQQESLNVGKEELGFKIKITNNSSYSLTGTIRLFINKYEFFYSATKKIHAGSDEEILVKIPYSDLECFNLQGAEKLSYIVCVSDENDMKWQSQEIKVLDSYVVKNIDKGEKILEKDGVRIYYHIEEKMNNSNIQLLIESNSPGNIKIEKVTLNDRNYIYNDDINFNYKSIFSVPLKNYILDGKKAEASKEKIENLSMQIKLNNKIFSLEF